MQTTDMKSELVKLIKMSQRYITTRLIILLCSFIYLFTISLQAQNRSKVLKGLVISGSFSNAINNNDTVTLFVWKRLFSEQGRFFYPTTKISRAVKDGHFDFKIDSLSSIVYISVTKKTFSGLPLALLDLFIAEPGDSVQVIITDNALSGDKRKIRKADDGSIGCINCNDYFFSGRGSLKFQAVWELSKAFNELRETWGESQKGVNASMTLVEKGNRWGDYMNYVTRGEMKILKKFKNRISRNSYDLINTDVLGKCRNLFYESMGIIYTSKGDKEDLDFIKYYKLKFSTLPEKINDDVLAKSAFYPGLILSKCKLEAELYKYTTEYDQLKNNYKGLLRDRLLTEYLFTKINRRGIEDVIAEVLPIIRDNEYRNNLRTILESHKVGAPAYNFQLGDAAGKTVKLEDFRGKIVFIDFWFTGCYACATYYKNTISKLEEKFKSDSNVVFMTISINSDKETWVRGLNSGLYTSLSSFNVINLNTGKAGISHPIVRQLNIFDYPHAVIIDKKGNILINDIELLRGSDVEKLSEIISRAALSKEPI